MSGGNPLARLDPGSIYSRLCSLGEEWAEAQAVAQLLEETLKATLSRLVLDRMGEATSKAQAEVMALASDEYRAHVEEMVEAKRRANVARVRYSSGQMWAELLRSQHATRRAEMQFAGLAP